MWPQGASVVAGVLDKYQFLPPNFVSTLIIYRNRAVANSGFVMVKITATKILYANPVPRTAVSVACVVLP